MKKVLLIATFALAATACVKPSASQTKEQGSSTGVGPGDANAPTAAMKISCRGSAPFDDKGTLVIYEMNGFLSKNGSEANYNLDYEGARVSAQKVMAKANPEAWIGNATLKKATNSATEVTYLVNEAQNEFKVIHHITMPVSVGQMKDYITFEQNLENNHTIASKDVICDIANSGQ